MRTTLAVLATLSLAACSHNTTQRDDKKYTQVAENLWKVCDGPNLIYVYRPSFDSAAIASVPGGCAK